ncbi:MAG TPA: MlaD family protein [Marmoricola sp.]|nr:MlaD family protein [Marmoricola sp.]
MGARNTTTMLAAVKLGVFSLCSLLVTGLLAAIMGNFGFGGQTEYHAVFSDASMLKSGDDVRIAGVSVGEVKDVQLHDRTQALVTFQVQDNVPLTDASRAEVRFLNLVGDRYMSLTQGRPGAPRLRPDGTIPVSRTTPALNLTQLFNGFQPLFQALSPKDVNDLSMNIVRVLQGEGGTVQSLLAHTASLTNTLADRDQLIAQVVTNLSSMLQTVDQRHRQLDQLVVQLRTWMGHLSRDRGTIGQSVQDVADLTRQLADLLVQGRPYLHADIAQLRRVLEILNRPANQTLLDQTLHMLPVMLSREVRTGTYGSWYNYYLCDFTGKIILPRQLPNVPGLDKIRHQLEHLDFYSTAKRCSIKGAH